MFIAKRPAATRLVKVLAGAGIALALAACGSDYDSPPPDLVLKGTAAVGAAIVNAPVSVVCKTGTGTATTAADGTYTVNVASGTGPCVLTVTTAGGATLRSIAAGSGNVNITPLTELLVSYIAVQTGAGASASPSALVANANVNTVMTNNTVFNATVSRVVAQVQAAAGAGVTVPSDFLTAPLVAKSATNPTGNALDQVLDALRARNVITATGAPAPTVVAAVQTEASRNTITGATGGT